MPKTTQNTTPATAKKTRTTQTTKINGKRVVLTTTATGIHIADAPALEWTLQAAQVRALRSLPEYGRQFLLVGGMEAGRRGMQERMKAKATGLTAGHPDLTIFLQGGKVGMIENKAANGRLSREQVDRHAALAAIGHAVVVIKASSEAEAVDKVVKTVMGWVASNDNKTI